MEDWLKTLITSLVSVFAGTFLSFVFTKIERNKQKLKIDILIMVNKGVNIDKFKCVKSVYETWEHVTNNFDLPEPEQTITLNKQNISTYSAIKIGDTLYGCVFEKVDDTGNRNVYLIKDKQYKKFRKWYYK